MEIAIFIIIGLIAIVAILYSKVRKLESDKWSLQQELKQYEKSNNSNARS